MSFRLFYKEIGDLNDSYSMSPLKHGPIEWTVLKKSEMHIRLCEFTVNYT